LGKIGFDVRPKTVYSDIPNLPDPVYLGITIKARNYDEVTLYFRIKATHPSWTFTTVDLGAVASGAEIIRHLHDYGYRGRPTAEITDACEFTLEAYTDSAYTNLKWTSIRIIKVVFIKSDNGTWTLNMINNFDDGTLQDWSSDWGAAARAEYIVGAFGIAEDYALSVPYSAKAHMRVTFPAWVASWQRIYKSITTPDTPEVFAIVNLRIAYEAGPRIETVKVLFAGTVLSELGYSGYEFPTGFWLRIVVPLPRATTGTIEISVSGVTGHDLGWYVWLDDFKLISR